MLYVSYSNSLHQRKVAKLLLVTWKHCLSKGKYIKRDKHTWYSPFAFLDHSLDGFHYPGVGVTNVLHLSEKNQSRLKYEQSKRTVKSSNGRASSMLASVDCNSLSSTSIWAAVVWAFSTYSRRVNLSRHHKRESVKVIPLWSRRSRWP